MRNSECGVRIALIRRRFRLRRTPAVALLWRGRSARQVTLCDKPVRPVCGCAPSAFDSRPPSSPAKSFPHPACGHPLPSDGRGIEKENRPPSL